MADAAPHEGVNVQVLLRCRPPTTKEIAERVPQVITCNEVSKEVTLLQSINGKTMSRTFRFDRVFNPDATQEKIFKQAITPIVQEVMEGFNCTIFAYGQTGTGKTYTMEGGPRNSDDGKKLSAEAGVIPRAIKQIFDTLAVNGTDSTVKVSFIELYNEELTDLLNTSSSSADADDAKRIKLLEDKSGVNVSGTEEVIVKTAAEIYGVLDRGTAKRRTAETLLNKRSSRSHSIFTVTINMREVTPDGDEVIKVGKLNLVDLAGSENISRSGAKDGRAREAGSINQSLLTLGRVITALVEHSGHVPYRDSKLTRLLRDSLGGRTKTCIIATIAPSVHCQEETISTLDYAHRAKNIRNRPELNQKICKTTMMKDMASEMERLRLDLQASRDKNGVYLSAETHAHNELERAQLRQQVLALQDMQGAAAEEHKAEVEALAAAHAAEAADLNRQLAEAKAQLCAAQEELEAARVTIQERTFVGLAHARAEQSVAAHGARVTAELSACASDLAGLFAKLEEVVGLQAADRGVMAGVQAVVEQRLQALVASLASILEAQASQSQALTGQVGALAAQKDADVAALQEQVAGVQANIDSLKRLVEEQLAAGTAVAEGVLGSMAGQQEAYGAAAGRAAADAQQALSAAVGAVMQALQGQAAQLQAFAAAHKQRGEAAVAAVKGSMQGVTASLQDVGAKAAQLQATSGAQASAAQAALSGLSKSLAAGMQAKQEALAAQIQGMLAALSAQHTAELQAAVGSLSQQLGVDGAALAAGMLDIGSCSQAGADAAAAACASMCSTLEADTTAACDQAASTAAALGHSCTSGEVALEVAAGAQGAAAEALARHGQEMQALASKGRAAVAQAQSDLSGTLNEQTAQLHGSQEALLQRVAASQAADSEALAALRSGIAASGAQLAQAGAQHQEGLQAVVSRVREDISGQLAVEVDMQDAPQQRSVEVPASGALQALLCPPEPVLLQQFQARRCALVREGGDPASLLRMVTPAKGGLAVVDAAKAAAALTSAAAAASEEEEGAEENTPPSACELAAAAHGVSSAEKGVTGASEAPPPQQLQGPAAAAGKRSRIPTLGAGLADKTNVQ